MKFRNLGIFTFLLVATLLVLNSCQKEELKETEVDLLNANLTEEVVDLRNGPDARQGLRNRCFKLVFPITIDFPDGTSETVEDFRSLHQSYKDWRTANPDADERPALAYPISVILRSDDSQVLVNSADELQALIDDCRANQDDDRPHNGCFRLVYPVNIDFPDNTSEMADSRRELHQLVRTWRQENPDADGRPMLGFPLTVMLRDSTILTLTTSDELDTLKASCRGNNGGGRPWQRPSYLINLGCYNFVFPITMEYPDGTIASIEDERDYRITLRDWIRNNPGSDVGPEVVFPFDVIHRRTDEVTTIDDQDGLDLAVGDCR